ncbi:hypothetical protein Ocin01_01567 [Orchesella cincta]|uniref:Uncharacterized protein n=1 Tax=Orchesella cincta TaxID=48709 RepID=A0A1D2NID9_ORCCI|nr:hypothetical protein Ocin01_01567 [Orchesella cincta]
MATVSRTGQLTQAGVTGTGEWDSRLNRLLEDLQETVIPTDTRSRNAAEYREYRLTTSSRVNDEPPQRVDEKWVEVGNLVGGGPVISGSVTDSAYGSSSRFTESKSVAFADETSSLSNRLHTSHRTPQIEYLAPANLTTELKSGPTSPTDYNVVPSGSSRSPKIERKEYFSKASYTTMIKGGSGDTDFPGISTTDSSGPSSSHRLLDDLIPSDFPARGTTTTINPAYESSSSTETRKTYMSSAESQRIGGGLSNGAPSGIGAPLYASTPMKPTSSSTSSYSREVITDRSVTPPPKVVDSLKTPPMIRKILQSSSNDSTSSHRHHHHTTTSSTTATSSSKPPPIGGVPLPILHAGSSASPSVLKPTQIPSYDDPPERLGARYYTSTITTEHRERDVSPIRRFPSPQPPKQTGDPPKRLDDLLASFEDSSYSRSTTLYGGNEGPHKSVPYGPGTHPIQPVRQVRIDDNVTSHGIDESSELIQRKNVTQYQNPAYSKGGKAEPLEPTRNTQGPPVFYPPGQMFTRTEEESMKQEMEKGKGKGKMKAERSYKEKEKMKSKHSEKGGEGAVPVPVCLPVCCAAPCVIM